MSDKLKKIYDALVEGAEQGLAGTPLYKHVVEECPKATSKKIVKASLLALTDKGLKDEHILRVIYDLAIKHRLDPATDDDGGADDATHAPQLPAERKKGKPRAAPAEANVSEA
jgi:hypothetical protein